MAKKSKSKSASVHVDPYLEGLVAKLLDRLVSLEKKMDAMLAKTGAAAEAKPISPPRREKQLYEAICADCHKVCEVPFRPSEARPVYCKECFAKRKAGGTGPKFPVLTPVSMPPKPADKPQAPPMPLPVTTRQAVKKSKKTKRKK